MSNKNGRVTELSRLYFEKFNFLFMSFILSAFFFEYFIAKNNIGFLEAKSIFLLPNHTVNQLFKFRLGKFFTVRNNFAVNHNARKTHHTQRHDFFQISYMLNIRRKIFFLP